MTVPSSESSYQHIVLRPYQEEAIEDIRAEYRSGHKSVLFQAPTGMGKTVLAASMVGAADEKGYEPLFICNRIELIDQTLNAFRMVGIDPGIVCAGYTPELQKSVQIASVATLGRRMAKIPLKPRLIVWDECRSIAAAGWTKVFNAFPDAFHLGLDATPQRLDGKGLDTYFSSMVCGPSYRELMEYGALVPFRAFSPPIPDLKLGGISVRMGDYDRAQLEAVMDKATITGDAIKHYQRLGCSLPVGNAGLGIGHAAAGGWRSAITFCASRAHSEHVAEQYRAAGISAMHVDGETDKQQRRAIIEGFRRREIQMLCNVDLFCYGFDVPGVEYISQLRPTKSLTLFLQQCGRASRPSPGKEYSILADHVGNTHRFGLPMDDRKWSLKGKDKRRRGAGDEPPVNVRQCPSCFHVHAPASRCPECGFVYPVMDRRPDEVDGDLRENEEAAKVLREMASKEERRREELNCRTHEDLYNLGMRRGYHERWADHKWKYHWNNPERERKNRKEAGPL